MYEGELWVGAGAATGNGLILQKTAAMSKEHLTYFKVENFKRFDELELTDIGQFNLIVGDNNVGKTSLLEALQVTFNGAETLYNYHKTLGLRGIDLNAKRKFDSDGNVINLEYPNENYLDYLLKNKQEVLVVCFKTSSGYFIGTDLEFKNEEGEIEFIFKKIKNVDTESVPSKFHIKLLNTGDSIAHNQDKPLAPPAPDFDPDELNASVRTINLHQDDLNNAYHNRYLPIVLFRPKNAGELFNDFQKSISKSRKLRDEFVDNLKFILPNIEEIQSLEVGGVDVLAVGLKGEDEFMPLSAFGEGTQRTFEILIEILKNKGKRLFIDEVDTGIHFSRLKSLLKNITNLALFNDVQLFMTTHSLECQQAFAEVFEDPDMVQYQASVRQFSLLEKPDGQVVANAHNFEQLQYALEIGFETRGGKRGW